jgi:hypothetical protein
MSSFLKRLKRKEYLEKNGKKNKITKKHISSFYQILHQLEAYSKVFYKEHPNESNADVLIEKAEEYFNRKLDSTEKTILESKLHTLRAKDDKEK